ncbi:filamentous hemagglutinin N-terminal domain-containing protein [Limnobacter alexandrii]|uniref:two-partner secretion domain-containing protein n=1 Tax=Limnobacter alexandrii TaxID=2570352 RepID=UPI001108A53D|nr:filamentous hemagglutinin N-terminal domain-containing protein [Limnobacter alexandrii]
MNSAICTSARSFPLKPLAAAVLLIYAAGIQSAPVFQSSPGGNVTVTNPDAQTTVVTQEGSRAVANWREFSIDAGETVQFIQDNANSVILNRVTGEDISQILGNLQANGRVFLINPNGIVFGSNAQVSVNGLVASTLSLKPGMQSGSDEVGLELNGPGASIVNNGQISAKDILLIAPSIENNGTLQGDGNNSKVQLIAAGQVNVNTADGNLVFQVAEGHENAVIQQLGTVMAEGGQIVLLASSSVGGQPSVINVANLNQATQIIVQGDSVRLSGDIQSAQGNALLEVTARNIDQENAVRVAGDVVLNSDAVELLDAQNDFAGTMAVNVTGQLTVSDSNQLQIQGVAGNAILNAGENVVVNGLNVNDHLAISAATEANLGQLSANSLSVNAQSVNQAQNTAVEVAAGSHLTADRLNLTNSGNRFEGVVDLVVQGQAALHGSHSLTVAGEAGHAVLSGADVVLGDLSAGRLDVDAAQLSQLGDTAVRVSGVSTLLANSATLDQDGNEFAGLVTLDVTSQAELRSRGRLEVAGQVNNAALQAENLVLSGLNVAGDLSLDAGTIGQTTGIDVQGITHIRNASTVNLDLSNDFVGQVSLDGVDTAEVNLADRNQIQVGGQVGDITIVSTDATAGVVSLGRLQARSLTANANAVRHIDGADPDSAIAVSGSTQLTANHLELANNANDFAGAVHLDVGQAAQIHDANLLNVSGEAGETRLQANSIELAGAFNVTGNLTLRADSIQGNAPLTVAGMSTIEQAQFVNLNNTTNDFVGSVNLLEAGEVGLFDRNSVEVQGQVNSLEASTPLAGSGQVTLGELTAENLVLHSQRIAQNGSVTVHGESRFNAGEIELRRTDNDFVGVVHLSVGEQASLQDANELRVGGVVNALGVEAQTAIIDGLTAQGDLTIRADAIRQEGALIANGNTFLAGGTVNLATSSDNIFAGTVGLDLTGAAAVHASGDLELAGKASLIDATARGVLSTSQLDAPEILLNADQLELNSLQAIGDLTLNGGRVRQQGALTVEGVTTLGASDVELLESSNDFKGRVILNNAGQVALQDMNDIRIQGQAETLNIQAGDVLEQTGAVSVNGASRFNGRTVNLNNESNQFGGEVSLQALQNATIQSNGNLRLSALADELNVGASGNLELGTTRVETLNAISSGQIVQNSASALTVGQLAALSAQSIRLNNSDNDFQGVVYLTTEGAAEIRDRNDLQIQGEVQNLIANAGNGTLIAGGSESLEFVNGTLTASNIELSRVLVSESAVFQANSIGQSQAVDTGGTLTLTADTVSLGLESNDFRGDVVLNGVRNANIADTNQLSLRGTAEQLNVDVNERLTLGRLQANSLSARAQRIDQTSSSDSVVQVSGETNLIAADVELLNNNDFQGALNLEVEGAAQLRDQNTLSVQGNVGRLEVLAQQLEQGASSVLRVAEQTQINANAVNLNASGNDFQGDVVLNVNGSAALRDSNNVRIQGTTNTLEVFAEGNIEQSGALAVSGAAQAIATNILLTHGANRFGGELAVQAGQAASVQAQNKLRVAGSAESLSAVAGGNLELGAINSGQLTAEAGGQISQIDSTALEINGGALLSAQSVLLNSAGNDFKGILNLAVAGNTTVSDQNDLQIQGVSQSLSANAENGTLIAGGSDNLKVVSGNLTASTIEVNRLEVTGAARLQANLITQSEAVSTGGQLTLAAPVVELTHADNKFAGELILADAGVVNLADGNELTVGGTVGELNVSAQELLTFTNLSASHLNARAKGIVQSDQANQVVRVSGETNLAGENVELLNNNDFQGALNLEVEGAAQLRDQNTLSVQGSVGQLEASARTLEQSGALSVAGSTLMNVNTATLDHSANDFQGEVVFNASGNVHVVDANTLSVSGQVNGSAQFTAQHVDQSNALQTGSSMLVQSENVNLSNSDNQFNGAVRIENAVEANLNSSGTLSVTGANLGNVSLTADEVTLGALGQLQTLNVVADKVDQNSALLVQGQTTLTVRKAELSQSSNDFVGDVLVQARAASNPDLEITDINSLTVRADDLRLGAQVQGDLTVRADDLVLGQSAVLGDSQIFLTGDLTQNGAASLGDALLSADRIVLSNSSNRFAGTVQIDSSDEVVLRTAGDFNANVGSSTATLTLNVNGNANLQGEHVRFARSQFDKNLTVNANQISQEQAGGSALEVRGNTELAALGGTINLSNSSNRFAGLVSATAEQTNIAARNDLQLLNLNSRGGNIVADGRLFLLGNIEQSGGTLTFAAHGVPRPLSSAEIALLLPPTLDVFSAKEAVNPITGLGRISLASTAIEQTGGQITTAAGSLTRFMAIQNGSVVLTKDNQINGQISALSGDHFSSPFDYLPNRGASLFAVNNNVKLTVGAQGVEADVIAIRSRGLATQGQESLIRARMPYNDVAVGTARSYAGLTLSIPLNGAVGGSGPVASFGESSANGLPGSAGAIRVEVGDISRPGLGGFLTVLPFEGSNLLPGQVVYLAGPERNGMQAFFYDGARSLNRVPVVYNGSLLLSPQENAALTTAQGAVVLARQEQTRSVVRTENVAGKIINGVVVEVGPGSPATEGEGGAGKPSSCDAADTGLACNP